MNTVLLVILIFGSWVGLAVGFLWLNDRYMDWRNRDRRTPEQKIQDETTLVARLENPKWDEVERVTGGRPGPALVALYSDLSLIHRKNFYIRHPPPNFEKLQEEHIDYFEPADEITLRKPWVEILPKNAFPFAKDMFGDFLFLELNPAGEDLPVKHWFHDGGDIVIIAPSLAAFLSWQRLDWPLPE